MVTQKVTIFNRSGLHARPASMVAQVCSKYVSDIYLGIGSNKVNAKSVMGIMTLGAGYGTVLEVHVEGPDEDEAIRAINDLFLNRFESERS